MQVLLLLHGMEHSFKDIIMQYKLVPNSVVPQLNRIFANATVDNKSVYLIQLASGKTEQDLNACLNFNAYGAGYYFDITRMAGIATLLGTGNDLTRSISGESITFSSCNMLCTVAGTPTHIVLGGIAPFVVEIGSDVSLLYVDSGVEVEKTGEGSVVTMPSFSIVLEGLYDGGLQGISLFDMNFASNSYRDFTAQEQNYIKSIGTSDFEITFDFLATALPAANLIGIIALCANPTNVGSVLPTEGFHLRFGTGTQHNNQLVVGADSSIITGMARVYDRDKTFFSAANGTRTITIVRNSGKVFVRMNGTILPLYVGQSGTVSVNLSVPDNFANFTAMRLGDPQGGSTYKITNFTLRKL